MTEAGLCFCLWLLMRTYKIESFYLFVFLFTFSDIYVCVVSFTHNVAAKGFYIAIVSTKVETSNPLQELKPGLDLLGEVKEK